MARKTNLSFETAALTDVGRVRKNNEDCVFALNGREPNAFGAESYGIYVIADGMGGHRAGEVASEMATQIVSATLIDSLGREGKSRSPSYLVKHTVEQANKQIFDMAATRPELYSMGTTITLGFRLDDALYIGHVGDSRAYLIRKGTIRRLTEDHSLVAQLLKEGKITPEESKRHLDRGKILRCLGASDNVTVDTLIKNGKERILTLYIGDTLLFCSDGLTSDVTDDEILDCIKESNNAKDTCKKLIDLANYKGGGDNISIIIVRVCQESASLETKGS
jgi:serine/threonine protein phosphatase PrpC